MRPVLIAVVVIVHRINRLLPFALDHIVPGHLTRKREFAPCNACDQMVLIRIVGHHVDGIALPPRGRAATADDVRLCRKAVVIGPDVTLGEVAELQGEESATRKL